MPDQNDAAAIVRDAGGEIVGRTKLQKVAFLLEITGLGSGFSFEYKHYGPYSEELAQCIAVADAFDLVREEERKASWGGFYSIYKSEAVDRGNADPQRVAFAERVVIADAVELELAATAAYLSEFEKCQDPWSETQKRKPEKATEDRIDAAKRLYRDLMALPTPRRLPELV